MHLQMNEKFVLATLYYLDSQDRLDLFQQELPVQTGLSWQECHECLQKLARFELIEYIQKRVRLKVKPLTYE
jgi:DNA-binding IclR family transcriptional regulator